MYLQRHLSKSFPSQVRERGLRLFQAGCVRDLQGNQWKVDASVQGTMLYHTSLVRAENALEGTCDCPYFADNGVCKHCWATILAAEKRSYLLGRIGSAPLHFAGPDEDDLEFEDEEDDEDEELLELPARPPSRHSWLQPGKRLTPKIAKPSPPSWRLFLNHVANSPIQISPGEPWRADREIYYVVDVGHTISSSGLYLEVNCREPRKTGGWGKVKQYRVARAHIADIPDPRDREILLMLGGVPEPYAYNTANVPCVYRIRNAPARLLLPKLCATGRCRLRLDDNVPFENQTVLAWDDGPPWQFHLRVEQKDKNWVMRGYLKRDGEEMDLNTPHVLLDDGLLFANGKVGLFEHGGAFAWIVHLRQKPEIDVPSKQGFDFVTEMLNRPVLPPVQWPEGLRFDEVRNEPRPALKLEKQKVGWHGEPTLTASLSFDYGGVVIPLDQTGTGIYEPGERRFWHRDQAREQAAIQRLMDLGLRKAERYYGSPVLTRWTVPPKRLPKIIQALAAENWQIESEGKLFRNAGVFEAELTSGIDWFELHGAVDYGGEKVKLPELLKAMERGENIVRLGDGSFGVIPEEIREKYGMLIGFGRKHEDHVRFSRSQAGVLDVLLAGRDEIRVDEIFGRIRNELSSFEGIVAAQQPEGFVGTLRDYQLDGVAWMQFLRRFGFGGCLADDMGVGKTPQVLALLETRRALRAQNGSAPEEVIGPSLAVVPRSLIYNWMRESERFTPQLRILDHTGALRDRKLEKFTDYDLILTTYGTLRRDAPLFQSFPFDYVILDEAQAIKNANTESAKAARLLQAKHRLALSGTPVENHLGELWSLFEFLNPGMLGAASAFQIAGDRLRNPDDSTRHVLAKAIRPFILRRTKQQVASELPPKTEQTLYCELDVTQRKLYNELRDHYRSALLGKIDKDGMAKSQIRILEALLRLRQAACHPGLIDKARVGEASAKLEALLPQLSEVTEEGHKALIFSQFTSFLAILKTQLDAAGIPYQYLDGKTKDREGAVQRFESDKDCKLFLISLKAGGVGLNLCAADYVFLLDPWWNPAVEAQAVDRAHRIGQANPVFAYRLIARDTVEEKVIELQNSKRDLADAIIRADTRMVGNLKREDLELLLS
jgi:superfamily II DNA or RNA helicase